MTVFSGKAWLAFAAEGVTVALAGAVFATVAVIERFVLQFMSY